MGLILASSSPRRALLLSLAGIAFTKSAPDVDESTVDGEEPDAYVLRVSQSKAHAVERSHHDVVLGADTTVVVDGRIIGKPSTNDEAVSMLDTLQGRDHTVLTGWTIVAADGERFGVEASTVTFHPRGVEELERYVEEHQPFDKAGGYALQGDDGWLVAHVTGSRSNVMGLPVKEIVAALKDLGIERSAS